MDDKLPGTSGRKLPGAVSIRRSGERVVSEVIELKKKKQTIDDSVPSQERYVSSVDANRAQLTESFMQFKDTLRGINFADITDNAPKANTPFAELYMVAAITYVTDPGRQTVDSLVNLPEFKSIPIPLLRDWAIDGNWKTAKAEFIRAWTAEAAATIGVELLESKMAELRILTNAQRQAEELLQTTAPKSWEGVAKALTTLSERKEALAKEIQDGLARLSPVQVHTSPTVLPIQDALESTDQEGNAVLTEDTIQQLTLSLYKRDRRNIKDSIESSIDRPGAKIFDAEYSDVDPK